ncbi:GAF and ANTAR domain-containing protein [Streptomyces sp. T028]|uniref:GAF and ANTAR domain-containing protein n=1 Tax=Streptomyces sp. T028 TaxID=3394379 RepID=UPI003A8AA7E9
MSLRAADLRRTLVELAAPEEPGLDTVCRAAVDVCGVDAAAFLTGRGENRGSLHTTDATSAAMEDLQITVGEGPSVDAWETRGPVLTGDLEDEALAGRWPGFTALAHGRGVRGVFVFPLQVGAVRLGTLSLYRSRPGPLSREQARDAVLLAAIALDRLLEPSERSGWSQPATPDVGQDSLKIYQATGMAASQLAVGIDEAFSRLRAHAFGSGLPLAEVARQLLDGALDFAAQDEDTEGRERSFGHHEES